jgi:hypothetical protein
MSGVDKPCPEVYDEDGGSIPRLNAWRMISSWTRYFVFRDIQDGPQWEGAILYIYNGEGEFTKGCDSKFTVT